MKAFADEAIIDLSSGSGGAGAVSFRREKYVPKGGPDGGDGGRGGSVIFKTKNNLKTLANLRQKTRYRAQNGIPGEGRRMHGSDGKDAIIEVPPGTLIRDADTKELIVDLAEMDEWLFLEGGKGGKGNWHFKSSVKQVPRYAQPGLPGIERRVFVELNVIADIGFVGLPNAGKSSLLDLFTNAHPRIADYPFTTKIPNLGVHYVKGKNLVLADIPGIIEGASEGAGLGFRFLKHISRTKMLAFLIDLSDEDFENTFDILCKELESYSPDLVAKQRVVIGSKTDLDPDGTRFEALKKRLPNEKIYPLSVYARSGLDDISLAFLRMVQAISPSGDDGE